MVGTRRFYDALRGGRFVVAARRTRFLERTERFAYLQLHEDDGGHVASGGGGGQEHATPRVGLNIAFHRRDNSGLMGSGKLWDYRTHLWAEKAGNREAGFSILWSKFLIVHARGSRE